MISAVAPALAVAPVAAVDTAARAPAVSPQSPRSLPAVSHVIPEDRT